MPSTRSRALARFLLVPVLLGAGLLGGCGISSDDHPSSDSTTSSSPAPTSTTPTPTPTPTPSPTDLPTGSPSASTPASPTLTPQQALLTATEMPPLNDTLRWTERRTGPVGSQAFGLCAKFDVLSIGAEQAVERTFVTGSQADAGSAGQQVATFPDAATAARAQRVLQSWHDTCARRLTRGKPQVRPITSVPVSQGQGWWYLVSYNRNGQSRFHSYGVVVDGTRISLLRMDHVGQDHDYPPGKDPMQLAVKAAATKLG